MALLKHATFIQKLGLTAALISAGVTVSLLTAPLASAFGVGVQPSTVEMTVKPGDRKTQVVTIGNVHTSKTITMTMGLADWTLNKQGKMELSPPGESARSAADWVRFSPATVTLKPGTSRDVKVEISAPYKINEKGDHRFALLASTLLPELDQRGEASGVWNRYQLASLFYLTLTPSKSLPEVTNVVVNSTDPSMVTMEIKNDGDAHARLQGTAFVKTASGEIIAKTPLNAVVLNAGERVYDIQLDDAETLQPGENYVIDFDLKNTFVPQNGFRAMAVDIAPLDYAVQ